VSTSLVAVFFRIIPFRIIKLKQCHRPIATLFVEVELKIIYGVAERILRLGMLSTLEDEFQGKKILLDCLCPNELGRLANKQSDLIDLIA
jgi:hypothetical protein